ncbi:MAG: hypothetical protein IIA02_10520 [Proteobacteria bacterium]|nr:hypothetical protein [Pseudomonadota bacterium]
MTQELTNAAQQALEALEQGVAWKEGGLQKARAAVDAIRAALAQRPAAQEVEHSDQLTKAKRLLVDLHKIGGAEVRSMIEARTGSWFVWGQDRSLPAPQQATPARPDFDAWWSSDGPNTASPYDAARSAWEAARQQATPDPLTLGPLAKRNIYDAIRGAYDLGYNDARNARTVPGDFAPGYDGRSVEEDHGGALFNILSKRLTPATPEPITGCIACAMRDAAIRQMPSQDVPQAYLDWLATKSRSAGVSGNEAWNAGVEWQKQQAATPEPVGEVVAYREKLTGRLCEPEDTHRRKFPMCYEPLTRPAAAPAVPEDSALLDYLDTLAARTAGSDLHCFGGRVVLYVRTGIGSQVEASGAGTAREAIRAAMLAAAQAKGVQA